MPTTNYPTLSNLQCQVFYEPTRFQVRVNVTSKTIDVQPDIEAIDELPNKDLITRIVTHKINNLGSVLSSTQWTSVIGDTMTRNIRTVESVRGAGNASALLGVSTALDSVLDSFLEALSAAQLQILNSSDSAIVKTESAAFVLGALTYMYAIPVITLAITLVYIGELAWTKAWKDVPAFNFINIDDFIVAASGGNTLASNANKIAAEGAIDTVAVTLLNHRDSGAVALTVAGSHVIDGTGYQVCSNDFILYTMELCCG